MSFQKILRKMEEALLRIDSRISVRVSSNNEKLVIELSQCEKPLSEFVRTVLEDLFTYEAGGVFEHFNPENGDCSLTYSKFSSLQEAFLENLSLDFFEHLLIHAMEFQPRLAVFSPLIAISETETYQIDSDEKTVLKNLSSIRQKITAGITHKNTKTQKRHSAEAASVYYVNGLPTVVIAVGEEHYHSAPPYQLCHTIFRQLLPYYVARLSNGEDPEVVMRDLLIKINKKSSELHDEYLTNDEIVNGASFSFSCAISYKSTAGELTVASVGVGNDMVFLLKADQTVDTIRVAESFYFINSELLIYEPIIYGECQYFLPMKNTEILSQATVMVKTLQEDDQLIALNQNVFEHLQSSSVDISFVKTSTNLYCGKKTLSRANIQEINSILEGGIEKDMIVVRATVPAIPKQKEIIRDTYLAYLRTPRAVKAEYSFNNAKLLGQYKNAIVTTLEKAYPWRPALFGHHHHERFKAVRTALLLADTMQQMQLILANQLDVLQVTEQKNTSEQNNLDNAARPSVTPISKMLLASRWNTPETLKNKRKRHSGYLDAIVKTHKMAKEVSLSASFQ